MTFDVTFDLFVTGESLIFKTKIYALNVARSLYQTCKLYDMLSAETTICKLNIISKIYYLRCSYFINIRRLSEII